METRAAAPFAYPRPGEPILPATLRSLVVARRRGAAAANDALDRILAETDLGPGAWNRLPPETCGRLAAAVVDRVQTRIRSLSGPELDVELPGPPVMLQLPLERRTERSLRRVLRRRETGAPWTVGRYLKLPRFGGRAVLDILAAAEKHGLVRRREFDQALEATLTAVCARLPCSEAEAARRAGFDAADFDLRTLTHGAVARGRCAPFQVIVLAGERVAVRLRDVSAARTAFRIANRAVASWGASTIGNVAAHIEPTGLATQAGMELVERLLSDLRSFRWIDRSRGWFWFVGGASPLRDDLLKILAVARRLPVARAFEALFRNRSGSRPSPDALPRIIAEIPHARLLDGLAILDPTPDITPLLAPAEAWLVQKLAAAGGRLSVAELRLEMNRAALAWHPFGVAIRQSPLFETSDSTVALVGSGAADAVNVPAPALARSVRSRAA